jgi:hypothetical protein
MKKYEVIREVFNQCSDNTKASPYLTEEEIDDLDEYMSNIISENSVCKRIKSDAESVTFEVNTVTNGRTFKERYTFSEL